MQPDKLEYSLNNANTTSDDLTSVLDNLNAISSKLQKCESNMNHVMHKVEPNCQASMKAYVTSSSIDVMFSFFRVATLRRRCLLYLV